MIVVCGAVLWIAGCAIPMGENLLIDRDRDGNNNILTYVTDYKLQTYVPIPRAGESPVTRVNRGDLDVTVAWQDGTGTDLPVLPVFQADTVYKAEIKLTPRFGYGFNPSMPFAYHPGKILVQVDDLRNPTRTVTVTYNNSNDADITFITDYNLQSYIPVPIAGERPVRALNTREDLTVTAAWAAESPRGSGTFVSISGADSFVFELGAVYRASIELTTEPGYRFSGVKNFTYTDGSRIVPDGSESDPGLRKFTVTYLATRASMKISDYNLTAYLAKPVSGMTAVGSFAAPQYTGTVSWRNSQTQVVLAGPYQYGTAYTAELVLTPASGYTIADIGQDVFIHTGAETVTNPAGSGTVTLSFQPTSNAPSPTVVYDTILTNRIPKPVNRATPVMSFITNQYRGTVVWKNTATQAVLNGGFQTGVTYTAVVSLTALPGYTFIGIGQNVFTHAAASGSVTNPPNSATVTINFPPAGASGQLVMSFGPVDAAGSALKLMKDRKDDNNPLVIDLPGGIDEVVIPNTVEMLRDYNSPANITIDGGGRVLKIEDPGILLTVRNGITLTLRNLTLRGIAANNRPLVRVQSGGKLILEEGAVITGNTTSANAGGVWVNGGELVMNPGAVIKKMRINASTGYHGGGVLVDMNGKFTMNGGIIGGESLEDANIVPGGGSSAGGVSIGQGSFTMYGGSIQFNYGGGIDLARGTFTMYSGSIRGNISPYPNTTPYEDGGGVFVSSSSASFTMNGTNAVIENNHVKGGTAIGIGNSDGGGGVLTNGSFTMSAGIIRGNSVDGKKSGGGVCTTNSGSFTMSGGTIQNNTARNGGGGVFGTFAMSGGVIKGNRVLDATDTWAAGGVFATGIFTMSGGTIGGDDPADANIAASAANGVFISDTYPLPGNSFNPFIMTGGTIKGNCADNTNNYGVYVYSYEFYGIRVATFRMSGSAVVAGNNKVFLKEGATITIDGDLSAVGPVAEIIHEKAPGSGIHLLRASTSALIQENYTKFRYADGTGLIVVNDTPANGYYYADFAE
jgi:hypothetical protein